MTTHTHTRARTQKSTKSKPKSKRKSKKSVNTPSKRSTTKRKSRLDQTTESSATTAQPPKKTKKTAKLSSAKGAKKFIRDYLIEQNRPFNAVNLHLNLNMKGLSRNGLKLVLESLVKENQISQKVFGKTYIFWANQALFAEDAANLTQIETQAVTAIADVRSLQQRSKCVTEDHRRGKTSLTDSEITTLLPKLQEDFKMRQSRLSELGVAGTVDANAKTKLEKKLKQYKKLRTKIRRSVMDFVDTLSENQNKKISKVMSDIGIETDKEACPDVDFSTI